MQLRFYLLFTFFTLLFLFYPGNSELFRLFAYQRTLFIPVRASLQEPIIPTVPIVNQSTPPFVMAQGVYVVDLPSFTPLLARQAHEKFLPASTAKIITALVTLDLYKPEDVITVKGDLANVPENQTMGLVPGEKITVENLLYGILIQSGDDAAYALANASGFDRFIDLMNKKAATLNMKDSSFENPAGLDNYNQYSTPFDLAIAGRALLENKYLAKIVGIKDITIADVDYQYFHRLTNVNKLLGEVKGIGGLKTGYTEDAGENLVSFYKKDGHEFIIVILKSTDRFADTLAVVNWIQANVSYYSAK
jgi:serine-type D-Ala-D-Ala carboxypeptidase (penicillin-binding protein 5/6)